MHSYTHNLVALLLALSSASMISPSVAQTLRESNQETTINIIPSSSSISDGDTIPSNFVSSDSTDKKSVVISDAESQVSTTNVAAPQANPRIPIPSRIFATPSMQQ